MQKLTAERWKELERIALGILIGEIPQAKKRNPWVGETKYGRRNKRQVF